MPDTQIIFTLILGACCAWMAWVVVFGGALGGIRVRPPRNRRRCRCLAWKVDKPQGATPAELAAAGWFQCPKCSQWTHEQAFREEVWQPVVCNLCHNETPTIFNGMRVEDAACPQCMHWHKRAARSGHA